MTKKRVVLLYGGRSAEHEISIISARFIFDSLDRQRFEPLLVGIAPAGGWHLQTEAQLPAINDPREVRVDPSGPQVHILPMPQTGERAGMLHVAGAASIPFDVVFPVMHGPMGEDGCTQGLLELAAVPYAGSGVTSCAVVMDKVIQKQVFEQCELPVVRHWAFRRIDWERARAEQIDECEALGYPLFVKPANMGSSLGIRKTGDRDQLEAAVQHALEFDTKVLVERGLVGAREIECAVLGNHDPRVSVPGEVGVRHDDGFYSYDAKYIDDGADLIIPAPLHHAEVSSIQLLALRAFRALDCSGLARVDLFLTSDRDVFLNEVNAIPGFTAISMYPRLWHASGVDAKELVTQLIELAMERHAERQALRTSR